MTATPMEIAVTDLQPSPANFRRQLKRVDELAASMKHQGVLQPLVVAVDAGAYVLIAGHRRLAAATVAGLDVVPCMVHEGLDDRTKAEMMLVENFQREDLSPIEEAEAFGHLRDLGLKQKEMAARLGCSQGHISKRLGLLLLPEDLQDAIDDDRLFATDAYELARLADHEDLLRKVLKDSRDLPIATLVREQLDKLEGAKAVDARHDELERSGVAHITWPLNQYQRVLAGQGYRDAVAVTVEDHAGEVCHGATVDPSTAGVVWICLEPERHAPVQHSLLGDSPAGESVPDPGPGGESTVATTQPVDDVGEASGTTPQERPLEPVAEPVVETRWQERLAVCKSLLVNPNAVDAHQLLAFVLLNHDARADAEIAADMLAISTMAEDLAEKLLDEAVNGAGVETLRVAFALALSAGEQAVRNREPEFGPKTYLDPGEVRVGSMYLDLLERAGHVLGADELEVHQPTKESV